jgi:hypothetical protein
VPCRNHKRPRDAINAPRSAPTICLAFMLDRTRSSIPVKIISLLRRNLRLYPAVAVSAGHATRDQPGEASVSSP